MWQRCIICIVLTGWWIIPVYNMLQEALPTYRLRVRLNGGGLPFLCCAKAKIPLMRNAND